MSNPDRLGRWLLVAALLSFGAAPVYSQGDVHEEAADDALVDLERVAEHFRILKLREGLVLEPLVGFEGVETIEILDGEIAVNGERLDDARLDELLGEETAGLVRGLRRLGHSEREELFAELDAGALSVSEPTRESRRARRSSRSHQREDAQVVFGSDLTIERDEVSKGVVVFGGDLRIEGEVRGDAATVGGNAWVDGEVSGDVAVIGGRLRLLPGARVHGDVVSVGREVEVDDAAEIHGQLIEVPFGTRVGVGLLPGLDSRWWRDSGRWRGTDWYHFSPFSRALDMVWEVFGLLVLVLLACLALLLAGGPLDRIERQVAEEPWKSGLVGLIAQILFLPLVVLAVLILTISIIGIPLLLLVPFAILGAVVVAFLGFVAVAVRLGRWSEKRFGWRLGSPYAELLVGLAIVQVWSFVGEALNFGGPIRFFAVMFLLFGVLVKYLAWTVGLGAALLARFGRAVGSFPAAPLPPPPGRAPVPASPADEAPFWDREPGEDEASEESER